ncbi:hypothetical protein CH63R_09790 [Colletotrichum higginsianum IMI 349063]|uniref:Uncharacterized protein n=1 Tax=Colletotrichum higginsianum (strain IMI 349063) TaxID=759273 RepID=A0A1B7Y0Z2_COLHI|nr:uncharacterized protein CH63R_09790 [Colletotrichum higginsianum IMI 349063]OBR05670.1 hypothetical protein CH63R_09790 [Colletotrichum higginsianum IMI 349063]
MHHPGALSIRLATCLLLLLLLLTPRAARAENRFRRPPGPGPSGDFRDNPVYTLGSQLDLQWETVFASVSLLMWHEANYTSEPTYTTIICESPVHDAPAPIFPSTVSAFRYVHSSYGLPPPTANTKSLGMLWTVSYNGFPAHHDPSASPVYFIQMFQSGSSTGDITSHYFNITEPAADAASPSASAPSASASLTSVTFSSGSATSSPSSTTDKNNNNGGGGGGSIPSGTVAGIAVGAVLGAFAVAGVAGWMLWRRRKTKGRKAGARGSSGLVQGNKISDEKECYAGPVSGGGVPGRYELDGARQSVYE